MVSWAVLGFLASSFATFSKASIILSKAHSVTFTSFPKVFFFYILPALHISGRECPASSFCACNQCHCSISLAPSTLWLAIPAATDPIFLLAFLFQPPLETFLLLLLLGKIFPHFSYVLFFSHHFSKASHDALFSQQTRTTCHFVNG